MTGLLAACMVGVALYCGARFFRPALRVAGHGRGLEVWHLLEVCTMAAMLVASPPIDHWRVGLAIFTVGLAWSLFQVARRHLRAAHLRLAVGCAAMVAMLLPTAPVSAAPAAGSQMHMHGGGSAGGHQMVAQMVDLPTPVTVLLLVGLAVVLVVSVARVARGRDPASDRLDAVCEGLVTVAMGYMLLSMA